MEFIKLTKTDDILINIDASKSKNFVHKIIIDKINKKNIFKKKLPYFL